MGPITASVELTDLDDPSLSAVSGTDGLVHACLAPDTLLAPKVSVDGYVTTIFNDLRLETSECLPQLLLFSTMAWGIVENGLPSYDETMGAVIVGVSNTQYHPVCDLSGWNFTLIAPDGGLVATKTGFIAGLGLDPTATATTSAGIELLYNVDPTVGVVTVIGHKTTDAGPPCDLLLDNSEFTGQVHVGSNGVASSYSFTVTDAGS
jgi:hypothetical protein